jgi:hypothetical protein
MIALSEHTYAILMAVSLPVCLYIYYSCGENLKGSHYDIALKMPNWRFRESLLAAAAAFCPRASYRLSIRHFPHVDGLGARALILFLLSSSAVLSFIQSNTIWHSL